MGYLRDSSFTNSMKGKVIIAFSIGFVALILAWSVSKVAFREMLTTVQTISSPDKKLRLVNDLFRDIIKVDQLQRAQSMQGRPMSYKAFLRESDSLRRSIDSLRILYLEEPEQLKRMDKMKSLLQERDSLFLSYLKVREGLIGGKALSSQLNSLTGMISRSSSEIDSTIVTTEQKISTTRAIPDEERDKDRGILNKIFGRKKPQKEEVPQVIEEEVSITIDTLARASSDSVIRAMEKAVKTLARRQKQRSNTFIDRESELTNAGDILINEMLEVLQEVEKDVLKQAEANNTKASDLVNVSARRIEFIMIGFILITAFFAYLILTDISRSNAYREELEAARDEAEYHGRAKQRFLSSMSHEIRTPLQSIIGYSEQIRDQEKPDKRDIDAIYHSSTHLLHIVNEVLDYSRIVSGKFRFTRSTFNIHDLLEEVIIIMQAQAEKKSLKLELFNNVSSVDTIIGDPFRLKQVLFNLIGNAIKFTSSGTVSLHVDNELRKRRAYFTFAVQDTGPGIAKEQLRNIFNEFEQADASHALNSNGTGLGLSIVKALTEGQGGTVEVESEPGVGTRFTVGLRYGLPKLQKKKVYAPAQPVSSFSGKVWIVDDDQFILQLCCSVFDKYRIDHKCFNDPLQVLEERRDKDLKVVMMDMRMPGMNGMELCRLLREKLPEHVKIFALTAQALPEERQSILNAGFDGLLMKPFREAQLLTLLFDGYVAAEEPAEEKRHERFDLSVVENMAFGDKELLARILSRFTEDSLSDIELLQFALENREIEDLKLILHRIAGRTAQFGARELSARFRLQEIKLHETSLLTEDQEEIIREHIKQLDELLEEISGKAVGV